MKKSVHTHYHWIIALAVLLEMAIYGGLVNNFNSLYVIPVTEELGISRSAFSLALCVRNLVSCLIGLISSLMLLHFGYRKLVTIGLIGMGLGVLVLSWSHSFLVLALGAGLIGLVDNFCSTVGASRIIGDWYHRHRGMVLGTVTAATGLGGSAFCILQSELIHRCSWRVSFRVMALLTVASALMMVLLIRNRPDQLGLRPQGEGELPVKNRHRGGMVRDNWPGYAVGELLHKPLFYTALVAVFLSGIGIFSVFYAVVPHLQNRGLSAPEAARLQSVLLLAFAGTKILFGSLNDWIGTRQVTVLSMLLGVWGVWLLGRVDSFSGGLLAVVVFSACLPMDSIMIPLLTTSLFGYRAHDTAVGVLMSMTLVGSMLAAPLGNLCYDLTGTYTLVHQGAILLILLTLALYMLVYHLAIRERKREEAGRGSGKPCK